MKFCEECGAKLADDVVFCEECGAKQSPTQKETVVESVAQTEQTTSEQPVTPTPKLSDTCTPAKREIKGWLMILLLIVCSPWVLIELTLDLPDFLFGVNFLVAPVVMLIATWARRSWKTWVKWSVTIAYIIEYIVLFTI